MIDDMHLAKSPLIDTIIELRFISTSPAQVLAGLMYSQLQKRGYCEFEELPITQLPKSIRDNNESLKYTAYYRIKKDDFWVSVGPSVIAITCISAEGQYKGWGIYKEETEAIIKELSGLGTVQSIDRVSVRYINLFKELDILTGINMSINVPNKDSLRVKQNISFAYSSDNFEIEVVFATDTTVMHQQISMTGTILDINSFSEKTVTFDEVLSVIEQGHTHVEKTFVDLLKPEFLNKLR